MECQITLSNGETVKEDQTLVNWWRNLLCYCELHNLTIKSVVVDGEVLSQRCDAYFIIHDVLSFCSGPTFHRKGYGLIRRDEKKARIIWFGDDNKRLMTEIQKPYPDFYEEICINLEKK